MNWRKRIISYAISGGIIGGIIAILFFTVVDDLDVITIGIFVVLFFVISTFLRTFWDLIKNYVTHTRLESELEVKTEYLKEEIEVLERRKKRLKKDYIKLFKNKED